MELGEGVAGSIVGEPSDAMAFGDMHGEDKVTGIRREFKYNWKAYSKSGKTKGMNSGVYSITEAETGRRYIGKARNLHRRERDHWGFLQRGRHFNVALQEAFSARPEAFVFEVLERCPLDNIRVREQWFIDFYLAVKTGFNRTPACGNP